MNIDIDSKMNSKLSPKNDLYRVDNESGFTEVRWEFHALSC
jgi:hypothetical protein